MKKIQKWRLGIIIIFVVLTIFISSGAIAVAIKDMSNTLREAKKEMSDFADESMVFVNAKELNL